MAEPIEVARNGTWAETPALFHPLRPRLAQELRGGHPLRALAERVGTQRPEDAIRSWLELSVVLGGPSPRPIKRDWRRPDL